MEKWYMCTNLDMTVYVQEMRFDWVVELLALDKWRKSFNKNIFFIKIINIRGSLLVAGCHKQSITLFPEFLDLKKDNTYYIDIYLKFQSMSVHACYTEDLTWFLVYALCNVQQLSTDIITLLMSSRL